MMRAAVVHAINDLRIENVKKPDVPDDSILVKVQACAICGTDRRIYRKGDHRASYPVITGHEIAGSVESVSKGVKILKKGDRVCVAPGHGCGYCKMCKNGYPNVCLNPNPSLGYKVNGGFAEFIAVPEYILRLGFVNLIPESLSFEQASMSEILACCLNAQDNAVIQSGETVLIIGSGPAGIMHAHLSKLKGARKVIITQRSRYRLDLAKTLFPGVVDRTVSSEEENLKEAVMEETDGKGADVIYVCAPSKEAQESALELIANRGRINFFGGLPKDNCIAKINSNEIHYKEIFISGASSSKPVDNKKALQLLDQRVIDPDKIITDVFPLDSIHKGFDVLEEGKCIKVVIKP